ncbi:hypothetical protein CHARACLAT_012924 [Characodon lateralis]|uniref:Uncharacterized protein n=1 Tax=Characodon lateralis TaxID=208331 RepID=A0ABU7CZ38_9TELE|nr:hypothetical protein [Characodon lateralis]
MQTDPDEDGPGPCHEHIEDLTVSSKFSLERFSASDEDIRFFNRFASHAHRMGFWKQIEPATLNIIRVTRAQSVAKTDQVPHSASATVLQPIDEFFLFMNYLSWERCKRIWPTHLNTSVNYPQSVLAASAETGSVTGFFLIPPESEKLYCQSSFEMKK